MKTVNVATFHEAQETLRNADLAQALYDEGAIVMADALICLHGKAHQQRRLAEFAVFGRGFFRYYEKQVFPAVMRQVLTPYLAAGRADLVEFGYRATMNLTADFAGIDRPRHDVEETETLLRLVKTFSTAATLVHSTRNRAEVHAEVEAAMEEFERVFLAPSTERRRALVEAFERGEITEDDLPRDVITVLLRKRDKIPLADDVFRREIAFYLQAGAHSTANSMTHAIHEIFSWCEKNDGARQRLEGDIGFLQRCVHESLRLHPASPVAWRRATCPVDLGSEGRVDQGDRVIVDLQAANRDRSVFGDDAEEFNPERELPGSIWPFGLSFGYGVHACLGRDLDGGVVPKPGTIPEKRQVGIVTLLVNELLQNGARRDADSPPQADTSTKRTNWAQYPVIFQGAVERGQPVN